MLQREEIRQERGPRHLPPPRGSPESGCQRGNEPAGGGGRSGRVRASGGGSTAGRQAGRLAGWVGVGLNTCGASTGLELLVGDPRQAGGEGGF